MNLEKEQHQELELQVGTLEKEQRIKFKELIRKYEDIFVKSKNELGKSGVTKHGIDVGDVKPVRNRAYSAVGKRKEIIEGEIRKMLEKGVIRKSKSPWASPITLVPKKNGEIRFCVDYRELNSITKKDSHPLPRINDMLDVFTGSKWFTSLDMASGYWQVEMEEKDIEKTAFITHEGLYEFVVMPFGLCNAPATFQRMMHEVLGELIYTKAPVYIDDVNVHSKTFEQHLKDLQEVFERIRKSGLKLRIDKCHFCYQELKFLGYVIGKDGVKVDQDKIEKVKNFPRPMNITELRGFIGLASYYRRFIKGFSEIVKPLTELFSKNKEYVWNEKRKESFEKLKEKLITAPVLIYPDFEKEFILLTDASDFAWRAVLAQENSNNQEHVIQYASGSFTEPEKNYSTTEKECLAVIKGIEKFHQYLYGQKFKVITDHYALK